MKTKLILSLFATLLFVGGSAIGQDTFDGDNGTDWNDPLNWNNDMLPGGGNNVQVNSGLTADVTGALTNPIIADFRVGNSGDGVVNISAGSLTATGWAFVGTDGAGVGNGNIGNLNLSGTGSFTVDLDANGGAQEFHVGLGGGNPSDNQGFVTVADNASLTFSRGYVGGNDANSGSLTQSGGTVFANQWMSVGRQGGSTGFYDMTSGTLTVNGKAGGGDFTVGESDASVGTFNISGDSQIDIGTNMFIGRFGNNATGNVNISGSTADIDTNNLFVAATGDSEPTDSIGNLSWTSDAADVSAVNVSGITYLNDGSGVGSANLAVDLTQHADFANYGAGAVELAEFVLIDNLASATNGTFAGLAEGSSVSIGGGKTGVLSYAGGADGLDVTVTVFESEDCLLGDVNMDGSVDLLDVTPFVDAITKGILFCEADVNQDGSVDLLDVTPFVDILSGG